VSAAKRRIQIKWRANFLEQHGEPDGIVYYREHLEQRREYNHERIVGGIHRAYLAEYRADHLVDVREKDRIRMALWRAARRRTDARAAL
jgi:hypothetical protein